MSCPDLSLPKFPRAVSPAASWKRKRAQGRGRIVGVAMTAHRRLFRQKSPIRHFVIDRLGPVQTRPHASGGHAPRHAAWEARLGRRVQVSSTGTQICRNLLLELSQRRSDGFGTAVRSERAHSGRPRRRNSLTVCPTDSQCGCTHRRAECLVTLKVCGMGEKSWHLDRR